MRSLSIHPLSLAIGLGLGAVCLLSMSQATVISSPLRVEYLAHPRDMVQIREGMPYPVPAGKLFVLTALGTNSSSSMGSAVQLRVNGQDEASVRVEYLAVGSPSSSHVVAVPPGMTAAAGAVLEVVYGGNDPADARAWGYLAPQ